MEQDRVFKNTSISFALSMRWFFCYKKGPPCSHSKNHRRSNHIKMNNTGYSIRFGKKISKNINWLFYIKKSNVELEIPYRCTCTYCLYTVQCLVGIESGILGEGRQKLGIFFSSVYMTLLGPQSGLTRDRHGTDNGWTVDTETSWVPPSQKIPVGWSWSIIWIRFIHHL